MSRRSGASSAHGHMARTVKSSVRTYREEEAKRTNELLAKTRRETASTRAQRQATRPEYTLSVEKEKQMFAARTELSAVRTQTVCRDFKPHLGDCRFISSPATASSKRREWRSETSH
eukprot:649675-Pleurochrysis_carterae.AAC.1